eukprot:37154-Eustigmatos_ZCMA.PRE.1
MHTVAKLSIITHLAGAFSVRVLCNYTGGGRRADLELVHEKLCCSCRALSHASHLAFVWGNHRIL